MNWFSTFGSFEYGLCALFLALYLAFFIRTFIISRRLKTRINLFWVKFMLRSICFALLIVSLLGPSFGGLKKEVKAVGKDIIIALDLSRSQNCSDVQPSRLGKVKFEFKKVLEAFAGDRVALIVFGEEAFLYCPFTYDKSALELLLETASTAVVPSGGTDLGKAMEMARQKFRESASQGTKISSRILVLVSDGEDFGEDTEDITGELEKEKIKVFSLGVGTRAGAEIPDENGGWLKDEDGQNAMARLNPASLQNIANQTGGRYYQLNDEVNEVPSMIEAIQNLEGEVWDVRVVDISANKYFYFLSAALLVLLLDMLFTINVMRL